jgi:acyl-CoA thioester hydrolase
MSLDESKIEHLLETFPVIVEIPVAWGEMDALQHVNNVFYFRYFETARIAYFEKLRFWEYMERTGIGPILASTKCRYKTPLTYPDKVFVGAKTSEIKVDRFVMEYLAVSQRLQKVAAEGEGVLVSYNYPENKKTSLPEEIKVLIMEIESSAR